MASSSSLPSSLYGAPRPKSKTSAISLSSTSIHALSTELSLARSRLPASKSAPARSRPSKTKALFAPANKNVSRRAAKDLAAEYANRGGALDGVSERDLARSKKRLREKAKLYEAMKRGDFGDDAKEVLIDFDRKWAEHPSDEESEKEGEEEDAVAGGDGDGGDEVVEYEDEFGRTRTGKKSVVEREQRREAAAREAQEQAAEMNAQPEGLIVGNTIQTAAFTTATFSSVPSSSMLASALPVREEGDLETHYDANSEVRTKGVGFYQFSTNSKERASEMRELEKERIKTAEGRERVVEKKKRRQEELQARREKVKRMRRGKVGESWLEGFMEEIGGAGGEREEKKEET